MKLYKVDFDPLWPIGSALVILANNFEEAFTIAAKTISHTPDFKVEEVDMSKSGVVVFLDGNY